MNIFIKLRRTRKTKWELGKRFVGGFFKSLIIAAGLFAYGFSQNVGIGTATPRALLEVNGGQILIDNGLTAVPSVGVVGGNGDRLVLSPGTGTTYPYSLGVNTSTMWFSVPNGANYLWYQNGTEQMRLENNGNLGLGTTAPTSKLHILNGTITIDDGTNPYTFPTADGAAGQVLTTDGAGTLSWTTVSGGGGSAWELTGNAGTVPTTNFLGTTDNQPLMIRTNNVEHFRLTTKGQIEILNSGRMVAVGEGAGASDDLTDNRNVFVGWTSGNRTTTGNVNTAVGSISLYYNTTGQGNVAIGRGTLYNNVAGNYGVAIGYNAMFYANNTTTSYTNRNIAIGYYALFGSNVPSNNLGNDNVAVGFQALQRINYGSSNIGVGYRALINSTNGSYNIAIGHEALRTNVSGYSSIAIGYRALYNANNSSTPLTYANVAIGRESMRGSNTASSNTGIHNTAVGHQTLYSFTSGQGNAALGYQALYRNTSGGRNTAIGYQALYSNTSAYSNVAIGDWAMQFNTVGGYNVAVGGDALRDNTTGTRNTAVGYQALKDATTNDNTGIGHYALFLTTTGNQNTAVGGGAMRANTTGARNTAVGESSLYQNTTGSFNTALGQTAFFNGTGFTNSTALGYATAVTASNQVRLGNASVTSIGGYAAWTNVSDKRFKTDVKENVAGLELVMRLRPVTYRINPEALNEFLNVPSESRLKAQEELKARELQIGFIAQEVESAANEIGFDFHAIDKPKNEKDFYGLRYSEFVPVLVKAIQEQQRIIERQQQEIRELRSKNKEIEHLKTRLKKLEEIMLIQTRK